MKLKCFLQSYMCIFIGLLMMYYGSRDGSTLLVIAGIITDLALFIPYLNFLHEEKLELRIRDLTASLGVMLMEYEYRRFKAGEEQSEEPAVIKLAYRNLIGQ